MPRRSHSIPHSSFSRSAMQYQRHCSVMTSKSECHFGLQSDLGYPATSYPDISTVDSRYNKLLGPSEITLLYRFFFLYIWVAKTIKYKEILNFGTKKITLLYWDFVISVFSIMRVYCIIQPWSHSVCYLFFIHFHLKSCSKQKQSTEEPLYNKDLGTMTIALL